MNVRQPVFGLPRLIRSETVSRPVLAPRARHPAPLSTTGAASAPMPDGHRLPVREGVVLPHLLPHLLPPAVPQGRQVSPTPRRNAAVAELPTMGPLGFEPMSL